MNTTMLSMRFLGKFTPLLMAAALMLCVLPSQAQQVGDCELGSAAATIDANNVRANIFNNGHLFWKGSGFVYTVPKAGTVNSIFASGIWMGGLVNDELRFAGTNYGPFEFWPGPLDENGNPPADCSQYDRIFSVTDDAIATYQQGGEPTQDMVDWPAELGAPVVDGDGNPNNYNLEGGDLPELTGDETLWWVMNDAGNVKGWSETAPMGVEIQATVFAFETADALNDATFYKYKIIYKGQEPLENAYFGVFSDPDLGNARDDFVGSDTTLGLGFVYNGDAVDESYGVPPAAGYDFFQGALVPAEGETWTDPDGTTYQDSTRLGLSKYLYWINRLGIPYGSPDGAAGDGYRYLQGLWRDGTQMTLGGVGWGGSEPVDYMFPGDPVSREFWSEENVDGDGTRNTPDDRRFLQSTGPFTMRPGDTQEIVFGIVWAQSVNRLASIAKLRQADVLAQGAFNANFDIPPPPDQPEVTVAPLSEEVVLTWENPPTSNNYLNSYDIESPFLVDQDADDQTYTFEGYRVYQYTSATDQEGEVIGTFDVANNVTTITQETIDLETGAVITEVVANGSDSGVQNYMIIDGLTNFQQYHFGVQAYAYNADSDPKIYSSPINRVTVQPAQVAGRGGGTVLPAQPEDPITTQRTAGTGGGAFADASGNQFVAADVVNPLAVTGDAYEVRFYNVEVNDTTTVLTYNLVNTTTGEVLLNGEQRLQETGEPLPMGEDVFVIDGLSFTISGPSAGPLVIDGSPMFVEWVAPGGVEPCPNGQGALGCAAVGGDLLLQSYSSQGSYLMYHEGDGTAASIGAFSPRDFEIRFTEEGSYAHYGFQTGNVIPVPFEVWDIGIVGPNNENDPSDDQQMVPVLYADGDPPGECEFNFGEAADAFGFNGQTDRIYGYYPVDGDYAAWEAYASGVVSGSADECFMAPAGAYPADAYTDYGRGRPIQRQVLVDAPGSQVESVADLQGAVMRFFTTKPLAPGDVYAIDSGEFQAQPGTDSTAVANLDQIGIVPNPYKGASSYETGARRDVVRFTNLPDEAIVRVYTLAGTLVREMELSTFNNEWDLQTDDGLNIASGLYLVHVEVPGVGEKIVKFGVVKSRVHLELL